MANVLTTNPRHIDSTGIVVTTAECPCRIVSFTMSNGTALILHDNDANVLHEITAAANSFIDVFPNGLYLTRGLTVQTLTGGICCLVVA